MKIKAVLIGVILVITGYSWAAGQDISGSWEANVMGSAVKALVQQNGRSISGVAYIYSPFGKKDTYHFSGHVDNGRITARHHSGHTFRGAVKSNGRIVGNLNTKNGFRLGLTAHRM